jgi:hypothetical protein
MNNSLKIILTISITICFITLLGAAVTPDTDQYYGTMEPFIRTVPPISFNDTPVQYAEVNGVTLGYREFGSRRAAPDD